MLSKNTSNIENPESFAKGNGSPKQTVKTYNFVKETSLTAQSCGSNSSLSTVAPSIDSDFLAGFSRILFDDAN
jgi:hypothetical protein